MENEPRMPTVLLIDDEEAFLYGLKGVMQRSGFRVLTATTGDEGLRLAREHVPDVVICDIMMPSPNGFEVQKALKQDLRTAAIPFIFLTARAAPADRMYSVRVGADDYFTKPFDPQELIRRVANLLLLARKERARGDSQADAVER